MRRQSEIDNREIEKIKEKMLQYKIEISISAILRNKCYNKVEMNKDC